MHRILLSTPDERPTNTAQAYWEISKKLLIVPYVPGSTDAARPLLGFEQPIMALEERQTLLFMRATCLPFMWMYPNNTRITTGKARRPPALPFLWMCPNEICITTGKARRPPARPACHADASQMRRAPPAVHVSGICLSCNGWGPSRFCTATSGFSWPPQRVLCDARQATARVVSWCQQNFKTVDFHCIKDKQCTLSSM